GILSIWPRRGPVYAIHIIEDARHPTRYMMLVGMVDVF
ncbi:unnamed protein product, partial [Urochloa humidicola]